jgi:hypothetical protein
VWRAEIDEATTHSERISPYSEVFTLAGRAVECSVLRIKRRGCNEYGMSTEETDKDKTTSDGSELSEKPEVADRNEKSASPGSLPAPPQRAAVNGSIARRPSITIPPPGLEELEETYSKKTEISVSPDKTIEDQITELELWARSNLWRTRIESVRIWLLRAVAFFAAIGAAATAAMSMTNEAIACGCLAALAIAIDASWPSAGDRIARRRATHDLRELQHTLKLRWDKVRLAHPNPLSPKRVAHALVLLDAISAKREEIGKYLGDASPAVSKGLGN